jgi:beta-lactamase superfamily II metal-dependent hydrolase
VLALRAVQAAFGDCLLVEFGSAGEPRYILVDGGPPDTYAQHLETELKAIAARGGGLELAVLSHVDNDHIIGLLDLFAQLREQRVNHEDETITIGALWHNSFERTVDPHNEIAPRLEALLAAAGGVQMMGQAGSAVTGIAEGSSLRLAAQALEIPLNPDFAGGLICVDDAPPPETIENLKLQVVGPTRTNLEALSQEWQEWLDAHEDAIAADPTVAAMADRSIPNLSSIMLLLSADDRRLLLTGDGRGDHLLSGLKEANLLDDSGALHVDALKVAHHGSDRNATRKFFNTVTADIYVISANGMYGNPDLATLIWIVEAARDQEREIELVLTNQTPSSDKLKEEYPAEDYGYTLTIMPPDANSIVVTLAQ